MTYTIYLGAKPIACVNDEGAYPCFEATKTLAEFTNENASMVCDASGEEIAFFNPENPEEGEEPDWGEPDPDNCDYEVGFDPYAGCFTDDC